MKNEGLMKKIFALVGALVVVGGAVVAVIHFWDRIAEKLPCCKMETIEDFDDLEDFVEDGLEEVEEVMEEVRTAAEDPHRGGFVSLMIHEQYFYPDYINYLSDFEDRVLKPCQLLHAKGYTGSHISDITEQRSLADYPLFAE
jgi:hypothetical protein